MERLHQLCVAYRKIQSALPWLDCYISEMTPAYENASRDLPTEFVRLDYTNTKPRLIKQTDHSFEEIANIVSASPKIPFILVSGDRKLLYHILKIAELLSTHPNLYLATGNFCNHFGLERLVAMHLGHKLLFGTMAPFLDAGNAFGPIVLGLFDWKTKCDIAGNNFRRLLGKAPIYPAEVKMPSIAPFMIDSHAHTIYPDSACVFPTPHAEPTWECWKRNLDLQHIDIMMTTPSESNRDVVTYPSQMVSAQMCTDSHGRMYYYEAFNPSKCNQSLAILERSLPDPRCIGIKIHPAANQVYASDERFAKVFELADRFHKVVMSHTWGVSDYNPTQKFSCPSLFECHLKAFPNVNFTLGHAGGRANGFAEAVEICKKFPHVDVDLAGDLYHNGFLKNAIEQIGVDKMLFASDAYWIDPRCMLGMLLETKLSEPDLWKILRTNAMKRL